MAVADNSYIVTGADMVSLANKIREKAGVSDGLVWPDGLIETVGAIESGGDGFVTGTITPTSSGIQTITHNLGHTPKGVLIYHTTALSITSKSTYGVYYAIGTLGDQPIEFGVSVYAQVLVTSWVGRNFEIFHSNCLLMNINEQTFSCALYGPVVTIALASLIPDETYRWYVW